MALRTWFLQSVLAVTVLQSTHLFAANPDTVTETAFSQRNPWTAAQAKDKAKIWLTTQGKLDTASFDKIWSTETEQTVLDRFVESLALGNSEIARIIAEAKNSDVQPPKEIPAFFRDEKVESFVRSTLGTYYARALATNRVYEEALSTLSLFAAEKNLVDPATYFFFKAVCEYSLIKKREAKDTIEYLQGFIPDAPERYKTMSIVMLFDLQAWKAEQTDLSNISKLMDNVERRLDLGRGGKITQEIQKKIVFRLDELIKEKENQANGQAQANGGSCPNGGKPQAGPGSNNPSNPMQDSNIATNGGPGKVDEKKLRQYAENWGTMNDRQRSAALTEATKDLPPKYKVIVEEYFRSLSRTQP